MKKAFVGALFAAPAFLAVAAPLQIPTNVPIVEVLQTTNTYNYSPVNETNSTIKRVVPISDALVTGQSVSDVEPKISTTRRLPIGTGGADVTATVKIPKANVAKALVATAKGAGKLLLPGLAGYALDSLVDYGFKNIKIGDDGELKADGVDDVPHTVSDGYNWIGKNDSKWSGPANACASYYPFSGYNQNGTLDTYNFTGSVTVNGTSALCGATNSLGATTMNPVSVERSNAPSNCQAGYYIVNGSCLHELPSKPLTEQQVLDAIASRDGWPASAARAMQGMVGEPSIRPHIFTPDLDQNLSLQGPNSKTGKTTTVTESVRLVPGTTTVAPAGATQTDPGTKTTTKTANHPITYSGNSVSYSTVNNTTTNITNNTTNTTSTDTTTEEVKDDKDEQMAVDTPLGEVPKLYEKKYPDGLLGVWDAKKAQFEQTSFFRLIDQLTPKIGQAGSCPSWSIDLSWTPGGSMGVHELQPPCMIWPILKAIVIISALFLARALIFGG